MAPDPAFFSPFTRRLCRYSAGPYKGIAASAISAGFHNLVEHTFSKISAVHSVNFPEFSRRCRRALMDYRKFVTSAVLGLNGVGCSDAMVTRVYVHMRQSMANDGSHIVCSNPFHLILIKTVNVL